MKISSTENSVHVTDQMRVEDAINVAVQRVNNAGVAFEPVYVSAGLSGGNDSLAANSATYVTQQGSTQAQTMMKISTGSTAMLRVVAYISVGVETFSFKKT